ncbi:hypothetical protein K443DRAFT_255500 [Laccaria amethystina LaAM-08-1]|uniref:Uncharacterized protein n=1 Tax=Laccaria amethystina LaAM-08-1 TaxID=1095629 RepID=A0A0C9WLJ0_9AGAR|nr:hypothetical protein K443DRAFT_255500 [Laccaria amethystina LaAM-08-1]
MNRSSTDRQQGESILPASDLHLITSRIFQMTQILPFCAPANTAKATFYILKKKTHSQGCTCNQTMSVYLVASRGRKKLWSIGRNLEGQLFPVQLQARPAMTFAIEVSQDGKEIKNTGRPQNWKVSACSTAA